MLSPPLRLFGAWLSLAMAGAGAQVSFKREIAPLLNRRCAACHGEETAKGRYRLDNFANLQRAGESDAAPLAPGRAADSALYNLLMEPDAHDRMPQKADALPKEETEIIRRWIDEGAVYDGGSPERPLVQMARESFLHAAPEHYAHPMPITALAFSPDARQLAAAGYYEVTIWDADSGALLQRIGGLPERITALAWDARRNFLAVAGGAPSQWGTVALIDLKVGAPPKLLCDLPDCALCLAFSPDGKTLVAGAGDRTIRFFDVVKRKETRVLRQHADWVSSLAFNEKGDRVISASRDRTARLFDAGTGEIEGTYALNETPVLQAAFVQGGGGRVITLAARSRELHRWDPRDHSEKPKTQKLAQETTQIVSMGEQFAQIGTDRIVRIVKEVGGEPLFVLRGHRDQIQSAAAVTHEGFSRLATGAANGEVCVWNLDCGTWELRFMAAP